MAGEGGREEEGEQRTENYENTFYRCVDLDAGVGAFIARVTCVCTYALPSALIRPSPIGFLEALLTDLINVIIRSLEDIQTYIIFLYIINSTNVYGMIVHEVNHNPP